MGVIYVARSARLSQWASDVGLSKHVFKVGITEEPVKPLVQAGWAGETDWTLIRQQDAEGVTEEAMIERLGRKAKLIDPNYYPRIRDAAGLFKVLPAHVQNYLIITRALAGEKEPGDIKLKPADFATYLIHNALR